MRVLQAIFFFNFWNFTFQNEKVDREPKNMPFIRQLPLKSIFWPLPRYLFLRTFSKLLIVFSTKVNLLYLLYSMSQRSCHLLHYRLPCSCFILFPSVHTSLFMFHLSSVSPHFIDHVSFLFSSVHSPSHSFHLLRSISLTFTLFGCIHITWSFNLIVSFTFQPIPSLEINDLWVSLDKSLILDRYSLLETELRWFYYSWSLYIKQEIQQ